MLIALVGMLLRGDGRVLQRPKKWQRMQELP